MLRRVQPTVQQDQRTARRAVCGTSGLYRKGHRKRYAETQLLSRFDASIMAVQKSFVFCTDVRYGDGLPFLEDAMRRAAIFTRVSTDKQSTVNQLNRLREVAARSGWDVVHIYEETISGAAKRSSRSAYDRMLKDATKRKFDVLMAWDVSRLGRSLRELVECFETLRTTGVDLYLDAQALDTSTPAGRALLGMASVFSEFERSMLVERTKAGLDRARAQGRTLGRPRLDAKTELAIRDALVAGGEGMQKLARRFGVGTGTVQRIRAEMTAAA